MEALSEPRTLNNVTNFVDASKVRVGSKRDPIEITGQKFAVISFVAPESTRQKSKNVAIKIRGVFPDEQSAEKHAKELWSVDNDFDIHVVDMYEWIVIPPPIDLLSAIPMKYNQDKLDKIMKGYYDQMQRSKKDMEKRMNAAKREVRKKLKRKKEKEKDGMEKNETTGDHVKQPENEDKSSN
jgi:hypothetical protein